MLLLWLARLTQIAAAVSAVLLARRRADHRPFAVYMVSVTVANTMRAMLTAWWCPIRPLGSPPFTGSARLAFHVDEAVGLALPAALAITAIVLFAERRRLAVVPALAWIGGVAYLCASYPEVRGEQLRRVYLAAELGALCIAAGAITLWTWRRLPPTPARVALLAVVIVDGVTLIAGAWRYGFWDHWHLQQIALTLLYATLTILQVLTWIQASASRRS